MKVAHIIDSGGLYGAEIMLLNLCLAQQQQGLDVIVISIGKPNEPEKPIEVELKKRGIAMKNWRMSPLPNLYQGWKIIRYCTSQQVSLVHSHGYKGNILLGFLPKFLRKLPIISTLHGYTTLDTWSKLAFYQAVDKLAMQRLEAVVIVSESMVHQIPAEKLAKTLRIINNGIPESTQPETLETYTSLYNPSDFKLGTLGRLSEEKNFDFLIQLMPKILEIIPHATLIIYGEGEMRDALTQKIGALNLQKKVFLPGYLKNTHAFLQDIDLFINCSTTEGLPISLLEAMKAKRLLLVSNIPANAAITKAIPHHLSQIAPLENKEFLTTLYAIYAADNGVKDAQQNANHQEFVKKYTAQQMASAYIDLYKSLCKVH